MTLMKALVELFNHSDKSRAISFTISFNGVTRTSTIYKYWKRSTGEWVYSISSTHEPSYAYTEETIVSAIAGISGVPLHFNNVDFKLSGITTFELKTNV